MPDETNPAPRWTWTPAQWASIVRLSRRISAVNYYRQGYWELRAWRFGQRLQHVASEAEHSTVAPDWADVPAVRDAECGER